jgi:hypothetical protein
LGIGDNYKNQYRWVKNTDQPYTTTGKGVEMKSLNLSSIAALSAGGVLALLHLNTLVEQALGVVVTFIALNLANRLIKGVQK